MTIADALLAARSVLYREYQGFQRQVRTLARADDRTRLLMSAQGVGVLVSLTYTSAIDEPERFKRSKQVGAHFGLTPTRYQSGEKYVTGRISKIGDRGVRTALYETAHTILAKPVKGGALKSWAMLIIEIVRTPDAFQKKETPPELGAALSDRGIGHLAFLATDVDAVAEELKIRGVDMVVPPTSFPDAGRRLIFIRDNNGNLIEFLTPLSAYRDGDGL